MTKADLLAAIRGKHPEYKDVPDEALINAALKAHPEYQKVIEPDGPSAVEMMANAKNGGSTTPGMRGTPDQAWWDGFLQELGLEGPKSPLVSAAHPQTMGDFLTDIIPSEMAGLPGTKAIPRAVSAFKQAGGETTGLKSALTLPVRAYNKFAEGVRVGVPEEGLAGFHVNQHGPNRSGYVPESSSNQAVGDIGADIDPWGPAAKGADTGEWTPDHGIMDYGTDPAQAPRVAGKAPTLDEVLKDALTEQMGGDSPDLTTLPDDMDPAGAGPTKQSGKFGKSGQLGQAGGYTSGLPPTSDTRYDELMQNFGGTADEVPHPPEGNPLPSEAASGGAPDEWPDASVSPTELNPGGMAQQAQDLRNSVGSRDAARQLGVPRDAVRVMDGGAPSKIPNAPAQRIDRFAKEFSQDGSMGLDDGNGDDLLKSIMLMLGGGTLADYSSEDAR